MDCKSLGVDFAKFVMVGAFYNLKSWIYIYSLVNMVV